MKRFLPVLDHKPRVAILLSGTGSNAEKLLESLEDPAFSTWEPVVIVTDAPKTSRAHEICTHFKLPLIALDVREFYKQRGELRVSLMTPQGRIIREEWTHEIRQMLAPYKIDFAILAGFELLSNITHDYPCLNVHPGDLTQVNEHGERILVGLHTVPIEAAMLRGDRNLKSSIIIADPYTGEGGEMDSGFILGLSVGVPISFDPICFEEFNKIIAHRPEKRPLGGFKDEAEHIAKINQQHLKMQGDWTCFPPTVADFAAGKYAISDDHCLLYFKDHAWHRVKSVEQCLGKIPSLILEK